VRLPVKTLAEFVHRRGDLHARLDGRARAEEGIAVQRALQRDRGSTYQRERTVALDTELAGAAVTVGGRIDGCDLGGTTIVIEEIKTTRADPDRAHAHHGDVHWAQASLYAGLFRPFQRAMARRAYQALRDRECLLLEAPTGSGKTAAMLYPAIRALGGAGYQRVFFLTSRNTGAHAALDALLRMDPHGEWLRFAQISARERMCQQAGEPCDPRTCPMAQGYYDRVREAVVALLERRAMTPETIRAVAAQHRVCPHELSLDAALWSDVVIGDYNYLFDPVVRLQRFAGEKDAAVLVDEAHQLAPRVRDMLSLRLAREAVRAAIQEAPPAPLARRLRGIDRQLLALAKGSVAEGEWAIAHPAALLRALERFCDACFETVAPLEAWPATLQLFFDAARWVRDADPDAGEGWMYRVRANGSGLRDVVVELDCLDPGPWIAARLGEYGGHVRFSGTVSPLPLYQQLHGFEGAPAERAGNPFDPAQLAVLLVEDVPTYLQARSRTLGSLVELVARVADARRGHYLVAFPSFEYLRQFAEAFARAYPACALEVQAPGMEEAARAAFLAAFQDDAQPRIGLVVLGGVFGESVDFSDATLAGVVCVGLGLPPPSFSRDALANHFDAQGADGRTIAYLQPALVKVVQMAGRLLRGPADRGVLCLVDPRFAGAACRPFFPSHWRPVRTRAAAVPGLLANFWQEGAAFPRLRASEQETLE
jgi:DNA excision repair protein ERCC-2